jgi:hypothetical protein
MLPDRNMSLARRMPDTGEAPHPSREESELISVTRFVMIAGLTFHHMFSIPGSAFYPREPLRTYSHFVPDLMNGFVHLTFMAAVPALSVISGYLVFRRPELDFRELLRKRLYSVALPSWTWSAMWLGFGFALYALGHDRGWFEWANYHFDEFGLLALSNGIIGVTQEPFAFQFWFVHDLILTLLLAPLVYRLLGLHPKTSLAALLVVWLSGWVPPPFFSLNVPFFFCIGAYLGMPHGPRLAGVLDALAPATWYVAPLFALVILGRLFSHLLPELAHVIDGHAYLSSMRVLGVLTFAQVLLALVRRGGRAKEAMIHYSGYAFFIFAAHYPTIELVKLVSGRMPGDASAIGALLQCALIPLVTIALCIAGAKLLERWAPPVFAMLNGGRSGEPIRATR